MPWLLVLLLVSPPPEPPMTLAEFTDVALRSNHTLRAAAEQVREGDAWRREAGLPPNPRLGFETEGIDLRAPSRAMFSLLWEQEIVTGGKLERRRAAAAQVVRRAETEAEMQRRRVAEGVRLRFHQLLAAQEAVGLADELASLAAAIAESTAAPDDGLARIEAAEARLDAASARRRLRQVALDLAGACGDPALESRAAAGELSAELPELDEYELTLRLFGSPEQKAMWSRFEEALLRRDLARAEAAPDLTVRVGIGYDTHREMAGPAGWTGGLMLMLPLPTRDRNQHEQTAWQAASDAAAADAYRRDQALLARFGQAWEQYQDAKSRLGAYRDELLPAADAALASARAGAGYLTVLTAQRTLVRLRQRELAERLRGWEAVIELEASFLTDPLAELGPT